MTNLDKSDLRDYCKEGKSFAQIRSFVDCSDATIRRYMRVFAPTPPSQDELRGIIEVVYNRGIDKGINLDANDGDVIIDNAVNKIRTIPPTPNWVVGNTSNTLKTHLKTLTDDGVVSDEAREVELMQQIAHIKTMDGRSVGLTAAYDIVALITQQTTAALIDEHNHIMWRPDEAKFIENQADRLSELKKGLK